MSILSAIKQQNSSIDDLAALPQAMIMQMAQKKQISEEMLAPILARKAEMADAFARQNALQNAGQTPPTVMEQLMAQNAQAEQPQMPEQAPQMAPQMPQQMPPQEMPQDMGVAQLPIPERQYAGGGIIAFADGGMSDYEDDDYEDSLEEADYNSMIERAMNAGEDDYTPTFETRHAKGSPQTFPNTGRDVGIASVRPQQDGDIKSRLLSTIMQKESGGKRYDKNGNLLTSPKGAEGEMQVMRYTARDPGFGVRPAQNNSPDELKRVGDDYAIAMYNRYRDPKLAMIAYNMGPGATDKWLASGADPRRLPRETQGYISGVNLAHGGEVKHYAGTTDGSLVEDEPTSAFERFFNQKNALKDYEEKLAKQREFERVTREQPGLFDRTTKMQRDKAAADLATANQARAGAPTKIVPPKMPDELKNVPISNVPPIRQTGLTPEEMMMGSTRAGTWDALSNDQTTGRAPPEAAKSGFEAYMAKMLAREEAMDKQRGDDKNMALLTAGLGMLGGTSPYAFENIGKGALAGVQQLSESKKQRAAEQAALDKSMLYAQRYQSADELAKQNALYNRNMKGAQLEETRRANTNKEREHAQSNLNNYLRMQMDLYKNRYPTDDMPGAKEAMAAIYNRPEYKTLAQLAGYTGGESRTTFTPKQEALLNKYK